MANILVVDDELGIRDLLFEILTDEGHQVELAQNATEARAMRAGNIPFDLVLLDIWMPDTDGVTLLKEWSASGLLTMSVIMMSGHATIDTAVEATKIGAQAFLEKPITLQKLLKAVEFGLTPQGARAHASHNVTASRPRPLTSPVSLASPSLIDSMSQLNSNGGHVLQTIETLPDARLQHFDLDKPLRDVRDEFEKSYFEYHLLKEGGSMTKVAEKTGLERTHLYRKLKQLGVDLSKSKREK